MTEDNEYSFEEGLAQLEKVVRQLENGEITLDQALGLFEKGVALARVCASKLDECESKIELLLEKNGEFIKQPFVQEG